jgi:hypothetical protein
MAGGIVTMSASVTCSHGGTATPSTSGGRVTIGGEAVITVATSYTVASCSFYPPYGNGPCVNGQWTTAASRVFVEGQPVILLEHQGTCTPTGTSLIVASTQSKVTAT